MQISKNKSVAIAIAIFLTISMGASTIVVPSSSAHTPPWIVQTYAYIAVEPSPLGIGQEAFVTFGIDKVPMTVSAAYGDRWTNLSVTITEPGGKVDTLTGFVADDTGFSHTTFTPTTVGNYTFVCNFGGQTLTGANPPPTGNGPVAQYIGDVYLPSTSQTVVLQVQQEPIVNLPYNPLPTGYWQRPINMENSNWDSISGNWLGLNAYTNGGFGYNVTTNFNPYTTAPNSAHIIWTQQMAPGGLIGGEYGNTANSNFYSTAQYEVKFKAVVLNGVLYYTSTPGASTYYQGIIATDLHTGKILWTKPMNGTLRCGQIYNYISPNQFGGLAYLWTTTYSMYDAMTGNWILDITGAAGGATLVSQQIGNSPADGSLLAYYVNSSVASRPTLNLWNSSMCIQRGPSGTGDPNSWRWFPTTGQKIPWQYGIEWTVPLPTNISGLAIDPTLSIGGLGSSDVVFMCSQPTGNWENYQIEAAYNMYTGQQMWIVNRTETAWTRNSGAFLGMTMNSGMYFCYTYETETWTAYSLATGTKVWATSLTGKLVGSDVWGYLAGYRPTVAYGALFECDYGGNIYALDITNGNILWTYYAGSAGYNTVYGSWPNKVVEVVADGKIYLNGGHTYNPPLFRGSHLYCLNATTGKEIWKILSFTANNNPSTVISDGIMVAENAYDNQIYAYAPGLSATTVTASPKVSVFGNDVLVEGTVTDQSPGQTCQGLPAAGTPAISDVSQEAWMEYIYEQQPIPTNATGVPVSIDVIDANNNFRHIGSATSDATGAFSFQWTPDIPGKYTVVASFGGSNSYYASSAETSFAVNTAPAPSSTATTSTSVSVADTYFVPAIAGLFVLIIIVLALVVLQMIRKRP